MNYIISENANYKSVEISFPAKPDQETRDALKKLGFRWHGQKKVWYGYKSAETVHAVLDGANGTPAQEAKAEAKAPEKANEPKAPHTFAPGDIVRVSGGYFANSNGLFFIAHASGSDWWLEPITKAGKIKKNGAQFWPLKSFCSDSFKNAAARKHNAEHAKMELAPGVPSCYVAQYFRDEAKKGFEAADDQERRGCTYAAETRARAEAMQKIANRFSADDVPPEAPAAPSIRIYWNGIKVNGGELVKCYYGYSGDELTISARDYKDLPREYFQVINESDGMSDYFEQDHTSITPDHPLFKFFHHAALKGIATGRSYRKMAETQAAEWATMEDPGQPTEADAEAAKAYRANQIEEAKKAREAKEAAEREAEEKRFEYQRGQAAYIREVAEAHPIQEGAPVVTILWSEHPAFYEWNDLGTLKLSVAAADIILRTLDEEQHTAKENGGDQFGPCVWNYYKTKFQIDFTSNGKAESFVDRYDLGDGYGGLVNMIAQCNGEDHPFTQLLREWSGGCIVSVTVAPWITAAQQEAKRAEGEIFTLVSMLTDEQIESAVERLDRDDPHADDMARFFIQELYRRDKEKALETWQRWQTGA